MLAYEKSEFAVNSIAGKSAGIRDVLCFQFFNSQSVSQAQAKCPALGLTPQLPCVVAAKKREWRYRALHLRSDYRA
jgi:hypothetical protein